jgi:hypothetical protein
LGIREALALPGLGRGVIHLDHTQPVVRIPVGEGVKAGPQDHALPHPAGDGRRQLVLRQATPHGQEGAEEWGARTVLEPPRLGADRVGLRPAQDRQGERVLVNRWVVE